MRAIILSGIGIVAIAAGASAALPSPLLLYNPSPSVPVGYYVRSGERPGKGKLIAFHVPKLGLPYAEKHMPYVVRGSIIKKVVADAGDHVCTTADNRLAINGKVIAPIADRDSHGRPLPRWTGCRTLGAGEYFVFSDRIANSYDSRYYGPVKTEQIIGTFRPIYTGSM